MKAFRAATECARNDTLVDNLKCCGRWCVIVSGRRDSVQRTSGRASWPNNDAVGDIGGCTFCLNGRAGWSTASASIGFTWKRSWWCAGASADAGFALRRACCWPRPHAATKPGRWDFLQDALATLRKVRTLSIEDAYTRQMLAIEVDTSLPALRVVRVLERLRIELVWPAPQKPHTSDYEIVCLRRSGDVEEQAHGSSGLWIAGLIWSTSSRVSPRRTPTWRALTASCAKNAYVSAGSKICSRPGGSSPLGAAITTNADHTAA